MKKQYRSFSFQLAPPWGSTTMWREVNQSVDHLIRLHRLKLDRAVALALRVQIRLESIFSILDELCAVTCPWCPDPCCMKAKIWVDFQDLLFLHLCGQQIPPSQLLKDLKKTCRYLGLRGCTLPRITRPWVCTWYLCPSQVANLRKKSRSVQDTFSQAIQAIKAGRKEMEAEFIRVVS